MAYTVKETYATLQGEGAHTGRAAVFCRFAGCNLWTGLEADRATAACRFCDTDFRGTDGPGGGRFSRPEELAAHIRSTWNTRTGGEPFVVFTGGEPLLQLDEALIDACHEAGFKIAVETNGTLPRPRGIDWVCVSPKPRSERVLLSGDELKLVFPQDELQPEQFEDLDFSHFFLQPRDAVGLREAHTRQAIDYCLAHPQWRLSLQTHKLTGIP